MRGEARVVALRPEYRRFARAVLSRIAAPRPLARQLGFALRQRLEGAEAAGATPAEAIAAMGDPSQIASALMAEHGLGPRPDLRRPLAAAAIGGVIVLSAAAGMVAWSDGRANALPAVQSITEILPHGTPAGARQLVPADLRGDGHPLVVGLQPDGAGVSVVAWDLAADGGVRLAGRLRLTLPPYSTEAVGHFLPGQAQEVAVVGGTEVDLVGWRTGGPAVIGTTSLPQTLTRAAATAVPGGLDSLYGISYAGPQTPTLTRLAWNGSTFAVAATAPIPSSTAGGGFPGLAAGQAGGHPYVALIRGNLVGGVCVGAPEAVQVFDGVTLAPIWQGAPGRHSTLFLRAPDGGLEVAAGLSPFGAQAAMLRWTGSGWTRVGTLPCLGQVVGLDPSGQALVAVGSRLERVDPSGAVTLSAPWPFQDLQPVPVVYTGGFLAQGPYVMLADQSNLEVARAVGNVWTAVWHGTDSTSVQGVALAPSDGAWDLVDQGGNVYTPAGGSWAWSGTPDPVPAARDWMDFCGTAAVPAIDRVGGRGRVRLLGPSGDAVATWIQPPRAFAPGQVFSVPISSHQCDVGLVYQQTPQTPATLQILTPRGHTLQPVSSLSLPPPPRAAQYRVFAVVPGRGRAEIVLGVFTGLGTGGANAQTTYTVATWDGRNLVAAGSPSTPLDAVSFSMPFEVGGRWLVAGLSQRHPFLLFYAGPSVLALADQVVGSPVQLVLGCLQTSGRAAWKAVPLADADPGQVSILPVPDGSGRLLVTVAGRTFVYRVH